MKDDKYLNKKIDSILKYAKTNLDTVKDSLISNDKEVKDLISEPAGYKDYLKALQWFYEDVIEVITILVKRCNEKSRKDKSKVNLIN